MNNDENDKVPRSKLAMQKFIETSWEGVCLDLGYGDNVFKEVIEGSAPNRVVETITKRPSLESKSTYFGNFIYHDFGKQFDAVWCSHTFEHQLEPHKFLCKLRNVIKPGGVLALIVPAPRTTLASGHVHEYSIGLLVYSLILAGFNCQNACVNGNDIESSIVMRVVDANLKPPRSQDNEHLLEDLIEFFPNSAIKSFNNRIYFKSEFSAWDHEV